MKTDVNKKLLRLISTEILLQLGFERSTEQALNVLTEIFSFYLESMIQKLIPVSSCEDSDKLCRFLIEDAYRESEYEAKELLKFIEQQISFKLMLVDKHNADCDESLLHALKLLPKGISMKSVFKNTKTATLEQKKSVDIIEDIVVDDFMNNFIHKSSLETSRRVVGSYSFDCSRIVEDINGNGLVPFDRINGKQKSQICGYKDVYLAEQELFIEDFYGNERYAILK